MPNQIQGIVVRCNGMVVHEQYAQPFDRDDLRALYSLTKNFASAAFGIAGAEGIFPREDAVYPFFGDHAPGRTYSSIVKRRPLSSGCEAQKLY